MGDEDGGSRVDAHDAAETSAASTWIFLFEHSLVGAMIVANWFTGLGQEFERELAVPCC